MKVELIVIIYIYICAYKYMNHVHIWGGEVGGEKRGQERRGQ